MTTILLAMLGIVLLAGIIVLYVAYPHRGQDVPNAPWVGKAMRKGVEKLPTLDHPDAEVDEREPGPTTVEDAQRR